MKPLNHSIPLRMKTCSLDQGDTEDGANLRPDPGGVLSTLIRVQESWNSKPQDPGTGISGDGGKSNNLRPSGGSIDHGG